MNYRINIYGFWLLVSLVFAGLTHPVHAEQNISFHIQENTPFTVEPVYPDNQKSAVKGYFQLSVTPGQSQQLQVRLTNRKQSTITVRMESANGYSSPAGGIMYERNIDSPDSVITDDTFKLASYIQVKPSISLPVGKSVIVPFQVTTPNPHTGQLLGGIRFITEGDTQKREQPTAEKGKAEFVLKTETVIAIAIQLDLPSPVTSSFSLGNVGFNSANGQIYMEMRNDAPNIQEHILGTYRVTDLNGKVLFENSFSPFKMAPKTQIRYGIPWNNPTLAPGDYTVILTAQVAGKEITGTKTLTIANKQVGDYIERHPPAVPQAQTKGIPPWVWMVAGAVLAGGLMYVLGRKNRKKE